MTHPDYFEGVLQLRNPSEELLTWIDGQIDKANVKANVKIAKVVKQKGGADYYLSSQKFLLQLSRKLPKHFAGVLKSTRKLFTRKRQTSKNIYRVNVLFRLVDFKKGDILTLRGTEYEVITIGKQVHLRDVNTGTKVRKAIELLVS